MFSIIWILLLLIIVDEVRIELMGEDDCLWNWIGETWGKAFEEEGGRIVAARVQIRRWVKGISWDNWDEFVWLVWIRTFVKLVPNLSHFNQRQMTSKFLLHTVWHSPKITTFVGQVDGIIFFNLYPKHVSNGFLSWILSWSYFSFLEWWQWFFFVLYTEILHDIIKWLIMEMK